MFQKLGILFCVIMAFLVPGTARAQEPEPSHSDPFWQVSYWNNIALSGTPVMQGHDTKIDWDWGSGSPNANVNADQFSVRWKRYIEVPAGVQRFTATSDDGIRVYVDGRLIVDQWNDHSVLTFTADVSLTAGHHLVVVEYYENFGDAVARVSWEPAQTSFNNWRGEYFNNPWLGGAPILTRDDANLDFYWGYGSPAPRIAPDGFSVRWTRTVKFEPGSYRFTASTDDGVRLWVNNHLLIDKWQDQPFWANSGTLYVSGDTPIKMEYYEHGGVAAARLAWARIDSIPPPDGTVIVDDADSGFVKGGRIDYWQTAAAGYNGRLTWTRNSDWQRSDYNWARWYPNLAPGRYQVFAYIPAPFLRTFQADERSLTTTRARYSVSHRYGFTFQYVNQVASGDRWVSLGTYWFRGTRDDYVSLSDVTGEPYASRMIVLDAIKWEPR